MTITRQYDDYTRTPYYLAEQRHKGRVVLAEGYTREQAIDRCLDAMLDRDLKDLASNQDGV